jgi:isopropylmalate/homocitrate/citramalate synthase
MSQESSNEARPSVDSLAAANVLTAAYDEPMRHSIKLDDDTLRDGEQTVGVCFSLEQKVEIARLLLDAGLRRMCIGFPAVSDAERAAVKAVIALGYRDRELYCLSRASAEDVDAIVACGGTEVGMFIPTSDVHLQHKLRCDEKTALERVTRAVRYARDRGLRVGVGFEDGSRTPFARLERFAHGVVEAGAHLVDFCDTVGILTPHSTARIVTALVGVLGSVPLAVHFHNDLGMAAANAIVACQAGARIVQGSFAGLGERAGNTCLEEVATILRVKFGLNVVADLEKLVQAAGRIAQIARMPVAPCKPILGAKVFSHESGIHVHGVTSEPATYEPFPPALVGRRHEIAFGKHSGLHSMRYLAHERGITATDAAMEDALGRIKKRAVEQGAPSADEAATILRAAATAALA